MSLRHAEHGPGRQEVDVYADDAQRIVTCACGMRFQGTMAELIPEVRRHGEEIHNMDATDEQIMAMSVDADAAPQSS